MQTDVAETISNKVKRLSGDQQAKILEFVEAFEPPRRTLWDMIRERVARIPEDVLERMPTDGSENHDHYIYGTPKK